MRFRSKSCRPPTHNRGVGLLIWVYGPFAAQRVGHGGDQPWVEVKVLALAFNAEGKFGGISDIVKHVIADDLCPFGHEIEEFAHAVFLPKQIVHSGSIFVEPVPELIGAFGKRYGLGGFLALLYENEYYEGDHYGQDCD